ncbi:MAG: hypothetical protein QGI43_08655 [Gemmatimonadota bacterium]|nr:hypothetical protein [Gemmatimonadota bacterium]MDP6529743.1 hypothetical protein [Gemmatimonadota bacterium]MDP7032792.1 hypothetical protein [Gemmatimonadota bacterium]
MRRLIHVWCDPDIGRRGYAVEIPVPFINMEVPNPLREEQAVLT